MTGHNVFQQMIDENNNKQLAISPISPEDFELWKRDYTWDALHGIRYGQSFCNHFGITDNILFYTFDDPAKADLYIKKHYIARP
jgi:hypothetical protein